MNIVLIGGQNVPGIGGAEAYMFNMAKALDVQEHNVTIICSSREAGTREIDGVKILYKVCPESNLIALPLLFIKSIKYIIENRNNIDVVNFQSIFFAFLPGWIALICGCKVCYTIHSLAEDNPKHGALMRVILRFFALISIWCCGDKLITVSNSKAQEIKKRYGKSSTVMPCGVNMPIEAEDSYILEKFNLHPGRYYLTIGRIDPVKNLDVLIKAYCKKTDNQYKLVIAGNYENKYGSYLMQLAGNNKNIVFTGSVIGADKETLLKNCFVNCLVSSSEGMPISLLEAMIYGKPCIVTDIPAIREIMPKNWACWSAVGDVDMLSQQMSYIEEHYSIIVESGDEMSQYVKRHHAWENISKRYASYVASLCT